MLPRHPGQTSPLASDHHGLLIIPIHWLTSSLCLLSTNKLVCGGRSGALWLPSHHPGGCCTLVVNEEIAPLLCKALWVSRKALYKCNKLLLLLLSGKRFRSMMAITERLGRSFFPAGHQAPKLKLSLITSTWLHLIISKIYSLFYIICIAAMFIPCTTCLHILLAHPCLYYYLLSLQYTVLHILLFFIFYSSLLIFLPKFMYILLCCVTYNCTVHWADLTYISLLIIFCIMEYVTNKT